ncbi:MAG: hypothetical protein PF447_05265 [Spirochaetaceae bacterium]|jgi:hypothetical protein|nr:hypothetical protein [Spirochaetaceae bacterium]
MVPRQSGALGRIAEMAASGELSTPEYQDWNWLMVSSISAFQGLNLSASFSSLLRGILQPGSSLILFPGYFVFSIPGGMNKKNLISLYDQINEIKNYL